MEDYRLDFRLSEASCVALAGAKHRTEAVRTSENSVMKLSENPHERANLLTIKRLIAT
jgi:hypothetical protein